METITVNIDTIRTDEKNPRKIDKKSFKALKKSVREFPEMLDIRPVVIDKDNIIIGGTQRYLALKELGIKEIKVIRADNLTDDQRKEFIIKDNTPYGDFDNLKLTLNFDFDFLKELEIPKISKYFKEEAGEKYTSAIKTPIYEPHMSKAPELSELYDLSEYKKKIDIINNSGIEDNELKMFLEFAATRFVRFNFKLIAEYYSRLDDEALKDVFKRLLLVIIDYDNYIKNTFVDLSTKILKSEQTE